MVWLDRLVSGIQEVNTEESQDPFIGWRGEPGNEAIVELVLVTLPKAIL